ncbi:hypothetical protein [Fulvitalea axinellae]|uniref:hypothetical protein n=1 Tax=Fulvitalea axinellae TaxID=1182444 RepID=UPI0030CA53C7
MNFRFSGVKYVCGVLISVKVAIFVIVKARLTSIGLLLSFMMIFLHGMIPHHHHAGEMRYISSHQVWDDHSDHHTVYEDAGHHHHQEHQHIADSDFIFLKPRPNVNLHKKVPLPIACGFFGEISLEKTVFFLGQNGLTDHPPEIGSLLFRSVKTLRGPPELY